MKNWKEQMFNRYADLADAPVKKILDDFHSLYSPKPGVKISNDELSKKIDHTLLKPEALPGEIKTLCEEAVACGFISVCVNPCYVTLCRNLLTGTGVKVCTVIGFPLGANTTVVKKAEAADAVENGAEEIDMVLNIGEFKAGNYEYVFNDIARVILPAKKNKIISKVIIETALLNDEEKVRACLISKQAGADFVKTSTGFSKGGAAVKDIALMKFVVGNDMKVKASGGIRSRKDAEEMIANGADRIGASAGVRILNE